MIRRFFFISALFFAFCLLCVAILWPMSYYREADARYTTANRDTYHITGAKGRLYVHYQPDMRWDDPNVEFAAPKLNRQDNWSWSYLTWFTPYDPDVNDETVTTLGIFWVHQWNETILGIPFSYLAFLFSMVPALVFFFQRQRTAFCKGCCPHCSYDLRAHKPGDKCPECGTVISSTKDAKA